MPACLRLSGIHGSYLMYFLPSKTCPFTVLVASSRRTTFSVALAKRFTNAAAIYEESN